jgi:predicted HNH restriction endonuclease
MLFPQPELLAHPNIPRPMQGLNPRTIKGQAWWNIARENAYAKFGYKCWACGVLKDVALFHHWLEAHESYTIDYEHGRMQLGDVVALCNACHSFIHSGRLWSLYTKAEVSKDRISLIINRGLRICKDNQIRPFFASLLIKSLLFGNSMKEGMAFAREQDGWFPPETKAPWDTWRMVIDGVEYPSTFIDEQQWRDTYDVQSDQDIEPFIPKRVETKDQIPWIQVEMPPKRYGKLRKIQKLLHTRRAEQDDFPPDDSFFDDLGDQ